ncbi:inositol-3-phosphate synthase [Sorangium sp. So ce834]
MVLDEHPRQPRRRGARRPGVVPVEGGLEARGARAHPEAGRPWRALRQALPQGADRVLPPRGDAKEGWDNIDLVDWLGYPMHLKINFLCRDSILAAPIVLDLALLLDLAQRAGLSGTQEWLSFYWKSPMTAPALYPEHDLFIQSMKLKNTMRWLMGEDLITHLGNEYYD